MQPISIHALRGEGDHAAAAWRRESDNFYPRPPWGGRQLALRGLLRRKLFLSTPSVGRATAYRMELIQQLAISIHALRGEGDPPALES